MCISWNWDFSLFVKRQLSPRNLLYWLRPVLRIKLFWDKIFKFNSTHNVHCVFSSSSQTSCYLSRNKSILLFMYEMFGLYSVFFLTFSKLLFGLFCLLLILIGNQQSTYFILLYRGTLTFCHYGWFTHGNIWCTSIIIDAVFMVIYHEFHTHIYTTYRRMTSFMTYSSVWLHSNLHETLNKT